MLDWEWGDLRHEEILWQIGKWNEIGKMVIRTLELKLIGFIGYRYQRISYWAVKSEVLRDVEIKIGMDGGLYTKSLINGGWMKLT